MGCLKLQCIILVLSLIRVADLCPEGCFCNGDFVTCEEADSIPKDLPPTTVSLKFPNHTFKSISHDDFTAVESTLEQLDASRGSLESIAPGTFSSIEKLVTLDLSNTKLGEVNAFTFADALPLESLDLSYTSIKSLQQSPFQSLTNLRILNLRGNKDLATVSQDAFNGLTKLEELIIGSKKLKNIPKAISSLDSIDHIEFEGLPITQLKVGSFPPLQSLRKICLDNFENLYTVDPAVFNSFPNLTELSIQSSRLQKVPPFNVPTLQVLKLNNNPNIRMLGLKDFEGAPLLRELYLSNIGLRNLHEAPFHENHDLRTLDLSRNELAVLPLHSLFSLYELEKLNISHNKILGLMPNTFENNEQLIEVDVSGNPLICDCDLAWLKVWHEIHIRKSQLLGECAQPRTHAGTPISGMEHKFFVCTKPRFGQHNVTIALPEDEQATVNCTPNAGSPDPTITWMDSEGRDIPTYGKIAKLEPQPHIWQLENGSLFFNKTQQEDYEIFRCTATNKVGTSLKTFRIRRRFPGELEDPAFTEPAGSGSTATTVILIIIGLLLPVGGAIWYMRKRREYGSILEGGEGVKWNTM